MARPKGSLNVKPKHRFKKRSTCMVCKKKKYRKLMRGLYPAGLGVVHVCVDCDKKPEKWEQFGQKYSHFNLQ